MARGTKSLIALASGILLMLVGLVAFTAARRAAEPDRPWVSRPTSSFEELLGLLGMGRSRKCYQNDFAAICTLRNISSAQAQFQATGKADEDLDGVGEFGTFTELTGSQPVRGSDSILNPPTLPAAFRTVDRSGCVGRGGFLFTMFLPGPGGAPVPESGLGGVPAGALDPDLAERAWCCLARPVRPGRTTGRWRRTAGMLPEMPDSDREAGESATEWFVYILRCGRAGNFYVGRTTDVERRFAEHRAGTGAFYTRAFRPTSIAWSEGGHTASSSGRREAELKNWSRARKLALIRDGPSGGGPPTSRG